MKIFSLVRDSRVGTAFANYRFMSGFCWCFLLLGILPSAFGQKALKAKIDFQVVNQTIPEALWQLSKKSQIPFSFSDNLFDSKQKFSHSFSATSVKTILHQILAPTSNHFIYSDNQIFIVKKILRRFTINGYVEDRESGERLIGANIYDALSQKGTSTNEYGFFSLTLLEGKHRLQISYLGFSSVQKEIDLIQNEQYQIDLVPSLTLQAVIVRDKDSLTIGAATKAASEELPIQQMDRLPTLGGEVDVLRTLQQLPGVQPGTDGIGGLHVRGGNADQNLILFDGVPVYNPYHTLGLYSIFDFDMIRKVRYFRGQFPARFGGRVSSVVDIRTKQGNNKSFHAKASIGLIGSKLALEGPLVKDKGAFYLSARRSHLDPFLKKYSRKDRLAKGENGFLNYSFGEIVAKIDYRLNLKDHLYLSFYKGGDDYNNQNSLEETYEDLQRVYQQKQQLNWGNTLSVFRWNHQFTEKLFANFTGSYSTFNFQSDDSFEDEILGAIGEGSSFFLRSIYQSTIEDIAAKVDFDFVPNAQHYLRFGLAATRHRFQPGALNALDAIFFDATTLSDSLINSDIEAMEIAAYVEEEWTIHPRLLLNAGVYTTLFSVQGKKYVAAEPRLSLHWQMAKPLRLHFSYSRMNQFLHLLTRSGTGLPTDLWVPSTAKVKPQQATIFETGVDFQIHKNWSLASNVYYKKMKQLISYSEGANFIVNSDVLSSNNWEEKIVSGNGISYGLEWLLKKENGPLQGWISYTLSKTTRQFDDLNGGKTFPFRFDLRHVFSAVASYRFSPRWQSSATWNYSSGSNINLALNEWEYIDQSGFPLYYYFDFGKKNSYQLPAYHRLDMDVHFQQKKKWGNWSLHLGVYNLYNQRNIFYIKTEYNPFTQQLGYKSVSLIPVLPYFRFAVEL